MLPTKQKFGKKKSPQENERDLEKKNIYQKRSGKILKMEWTPAAACEAYAALTTPTAPSHIAPALTPPHPIPLSVWALHSPDDFPLVAIATQRALPAAVASALVGAPAEDIPPTAPLRGPLPLVLSDRRPSASPRGMTSGTILVTPPAAVPPPSRVTQRCTSSSRGKTPHTMAVSTLNVAGVSDVYAMSCNVQVGQKTKPKRQKPEKQQILAEGESPSAPPLCSLDEFLRTLQWR